MVQLLANVGRALHINSGCIIPTHVYWGHLYSLPVFILDRINAVIAHFLWVGISSDWKYHLCKLSLITVPKFLGGWGLLDIRFFSNVLLAESLWRALNGNGIWSKIIECKYINDRSLYSFLCGSINYHHRASLIWRSLYKCKDFISDRLC